MIMVVGFGIVPMAVGTIMGTNKHKKMKSKVIFVLGFLIPILLFHFWHDDEERLPTALSLTFIFACIYVICFFVGIWKKKLYFLISFPTYLISFVLLVQLLNFQYRNNERNGEKLIRALELYYVESGKYPPTLEALVPRFRSSLPKAWFGLFAHSYNYMSTGDGFVLEIQTGNKPHQMWSSGDHYWQLLE